MNDFDPKRRQVSEYGRFSVHYDPLVHLPWGLYRIYEREKYIGAQISFPSQSDCEWLAAQKKNGEVIYAESSHRWTAKDYGRRGVTAPAYVQWRKTKAAA